MNYYLIKKEKLSISYNVIFTLIIFSSLSSLAKATIILDVNTIKEFYESGLSPTPNCNVMMTKKGMTKEVVLSDDCNFSWYIMVNVIDNCELKAWERVEVRNNFFFFELSPKRDCENKINYSYEEQKKILIHKEHNKVNNKDYILQIYSGEDLPSRDSFDCLSVKYNIAHINDIYFISTKNMSLDQAVYLKNKAFEQCNMIIHIRSPLNI